MSATSAALSSRRDGGAGSGAAAMGCPSARGELVAAGVRVSPPTDSGKGKSGHASGADFLATSVRPPARGCTPGQPRFGARQCGARGWSSQGRTWNRAHRPGEDWVAQGHLGLVSVDRQGRSRTCPWLAVLQVAAAQATACWYSGATRTSAANVRCRRRWKVRSDMPAAIATAARVPAP